MSADKGEAYSGQEFISTTHSKQWEQVMEY